MSNFYWPLSKSSQQVVYTTVWWGSADSPARLQQPLLTHPKHSCSGALAQWPCFSTNYSLFPISWSPCQHHLWDSTLCLHNPISEEKGHFCCPCSAPPLNYSLGKLDQTSCSINIHLIVISSMCLLPCAAQPSWIQSFPPSKETRLSI